MAQLKYQGRNIQTRDGENTLDAMLRNGINIPFSCRNGVCHVCLQRCVTGEIPERAQHGLRSELREQGYFMPCMCVPTGEMEIEPPSGLYQATLLHSKEMLAPHICKLLIEPPANFDYHAGQFINLRRRDGLVRSYSLAGLAQDYFLEIHVQRKDGGAMSNWMLDELAQGDELEVQAAAGECYYKSEAHGHPLLLVGTGTGMSPLLGIVRDALHQQHQGEIHLYHGARAGDHFYLRDVLRKMEMQHANLHYHECLLGGHATHADMHAGDVLEIAFAQHKELSGWQVYLAGAADMVDRGAQLAVAQGALPQAIHADAFVLRDLRETPRDADAAKGDVAEQPGADDDKEKYPPPDQELWLALREGELLMEVLRDFYGRIYQDARLASFFDGITKQRLIEKQYLFVRQILTGEKIYFGDRPRNSHHWMVVSDELFDHRANIMLACLREHGLAESMVQRFHGMEEFYRRDIVKTAPFARIRGGMEVPFEGFDELIMDVGTLCDSCEREVSPGEKVIYHVRIGKIYCSDCSSQHVHEVHEAIEG